MYAISFKFQSKSLERHPKDLYSLSTQILYSILVLVSFIPMRRAYDKNKPCPSLFPSRETGK